MSRLMNNINRSCDQISFLKLGATLAGDARDTAGCAPRLKTPFGLGLSQYNIADAGEMYKSLVRDVVVCGVEYGHGGGSVWQVQPPVRLRLNTPFPLTSGLSKWHAFVNPLHVLAMIAFAVVIGVEPYIGIAVAGKCSYASPFQTPVSFGLRVL